MSFGVVLLVWIRSANSKGDVGALVDLLVMSSMELW